MWQSVLRPLILILRRGTYPYRLPISTRLGRLYNLVDFLPTKFVFF